MREPLPDFVTWREERAAADDFVRAIFKSPEHIRLDRHDEFFALLSDLPVAGQLSERETALLTELYRSGATYESAGRAVGRGGGYAIEGHRRIIETVRTVLTERAAKAERTTRGYWLVTGG